MAECIEFNFIHQVAELVSAKVYAVPTFFICVFLCLFVCLSCRSSQSYLNYVINCASLVVFLDLFNSPQ